VHTLSGLNRSILRRISIFISMAIKPGRPCNARREYGTLRVNVFGVKTGCSGYSFNCGHQKCYCGRAATLFQPLHSAAHSLFHPQVCLSTIQNLHATNALQLVVDIYARVHHENFLRPLPPSYTEENGGQGQVEDQSRDKYSTALSRL
jgi:hypothetical protein